MKELLSKLKPTQILMLGFALLIGLGTLLLVLPAASRSGQSAGLINALFTATSAVCVTGLAVVNTAKQWSVFGKIVIISLIQVGGLGFMTLTAILFIMIGRKIGLRQRLLIQESLNQSTIAGLVRLTKKIFWGTLIVEGTGAAALSLCFIPMYGLKKGITYGIFHAVSAFCNAGFDLIGENSLAPLVGHWGVNLVLMLLIVAGSIGFGVWFDVIGAGRKVFRQKRSNHGWFWHTQLHTKLALVITAGLLFSGWLLIFLLEAGNPKTLGSMPLVDGALAAMFQSVTLRTAGFFTVDFANMRQGSQFISMLLMIIGGSPGGTAGGIKTVTVGILILQVLATVKGRQELEIFDRHIADDIVKRALAVVIIALGVVTGVTLVLTVTERAEFMRIAFEVVSAFATVGLSLGLSPELSLAGKLIICVTMFIGRLGPVTIAFALADKAGKSTKVKKPEGKLMVG